MRVRPRRRRGSRVSPAGRSATCWTRWRSAIPTVSSLPSSRVATFLPRAPGGDKLQAPDEALDSVRLSEDVQAAVLDLPYEFREAVVLCDVVGLSYEEIARATAVPVGTVRSRLARAREDLRRLLGDQP